MTEEIGFELYLDQPYDQSVILVTEALKSEGFGVLTSIDVRETLKKKLGEEFRPYVIIGACNPPLAHRALSQDPKVGLMLPCNVTVEAVEESGSIVRIANPEMMMKVGSMESNTIMAEVAKEARMRLERVINELRSK
jgi:uncharacterized protein (DUF302 family)